MGEEREGGRGREGEGGERRGKGRRGEGGEIEGGKERGENGGGKERHYYLTTIT